MSINKPKGVQTLLLDAAAETGWNTDSMVTVLLRFIEEQARVQGTHQAFADFLADRILEESVLGSQNLQEGVDGVSV